MKKHGNPSRHTSAQPNSSSSQSLPSACFLGLAFVHMWIYCSTHRPSVTDDVSVMVIMYLALSVGLGALLAATITRARRGPDSSPASSGQHEGRRFLAPDVVCAAFMTLSAVLLTLPIDLPPVPVTAAASILGGIGVGWAYARWCDLYAQLDIRVSAPLVLVTMALGSIGKTVIDFLPAVPAALVLACLPAATFACVRRASSRVAAARAMVQKETTPAPGLVASDPPRYYNSRTIGSLGRIAAGVAIYSLAMGVIQSVLLETMPSYSASVVFHHASEVAVALGLLAWITAFHHRLDFSQTWKIIAALLVTALIFEPFMASDLINYLLSLARTAQTALIVLLFLALADIARHSSYSPFAVFSAGWIAYSLPFALGKLAGDLMVRSGMPLVLALSMTAWTLVIVALFVLDESSLGNRLIFAELNDVDDQDSLARRISRMQQELGEAGTLTAQVAAAMGTSAASSIRVGALQTPLPAAVRADGATDASSASGAVAGSVDPPAAGRPELTDVTALRCQRLADAGKLTPRESEILLLLARGRSKTHIAEAFFISENTVRNHVKHVYAKLDVHNRQELLDKIESEPVE